MNSEMLSDDELDRLLSEASRTRPVNPAAGGAEHVDAALTDLWQSIESGGARQARSQSTAKPAYRRRLAAVGAVAAAVGVASLVGVNSLKGGSGGGNLPLAVSPAAAAQLDRIAHGAAGWSGLSAGQWRYVSYTDQTTASHQQVGNATVTYSYTTRYQTWTTATGDERDRVTSGGRFAFATPQDQANYEANKAAWNKLMGPGSSATNPVNNIPIVNDVMNPAANEYDIAPTSDPQTLISELSAAHGHSPIELQSRLQNILFEVASAPLRAAAFAALAYVPGTKVLGNRTDTRGRQGIAISLTLPDEYPTTMIVDPSTGDVLEDVMTQPGPFPAGTSTDIQTFDRPAVVDSDTALPGGDTLSVATANPLIGTNPAATPTTPSTSTAPETRTSTR